METARDLWKKLQPLRRDDAGVRQNPGGGARPQGHLGRAEAGRRSRLPRLDRRRHVRHAAFKGLREDKPATGDRAGEADGRRKRSKSQRQTATERKRARARRRRRARPMPAPVKLTHPDRVYWTDVGITKQQLADYYTSVWDRMAPHVVNRPLALVRCPDGHRAGMLLPEARRRGPRQRAHPTPSRTAKAKELIYIEDLDGLLTLVQAGVLEIHVWGSTIDDSSTANRIVFDLDPGDGVTWARRERGRARSARAARRTEARKLREDDRRQGPACRGADRRHAVGRRPRTSRTRWCWRWRRTNPTATSPR